MKVLNCVWDIIFPPRCIFCNEVLEIGTVCACKKECELKYRLRGAEREFQKKISGVSVAISSFRYGGPVPSAVHRFKFRSGWVIAKEMAEYMAKDLADYKSESDSYVIVPVPSYRNRTHHCKMLAKHLSLKLGIVMDTKLLSKVRKTKKQHKLSAKERSTNLVNAFRASKDVKGKRIIICDDVLTSGATLSHAAKELINSGATEVLTITFARASK